MLACLTPDTHHVLVCGGQACGPIVFSKGPDMLLPAPPAAGDDMLQLDCVLPYTPTPAPSLTWVPGAEDFLCALQSLGCTTTPSSSNSSSRDAGGGGGTTGSTTAAAPRSSRQQQGRSKHTAATANTSSSSSSSAAAADTCYRDAPLRQALVLCAHVLRLGAAGQLEVPLPEAAAKQLGPLLLSLQLDARVRLGALGPAQEALAALAEVCARGCEDLWAM